MPVKKQYIDRIGIKGTANQLLDSVPNLTEILRILGDSLNFSVEINLEEENELEDKSVREKIISDFIKTAKEHKRETGYNFSGVAIHIPLFKFKGLDLNLLSFDRKIWRNSIELIETILSMAKIIESKTKIKTRIVIHGYSLNPFEDENARIIDKRGLYEFTKHYKHSGIEKALKEFSLKERQMMGIETTGAGPCVLPKDLVKIAKKSNCFIVQDVGHMTRSFYLDKNLKTHSYNYNTKQKIKNGIKLMLPHTKHWHICQHHGNPQHNDWHLAMPGIIDWPDIIPLMTESFKKNDATAIIEVKSKDYSKPIAGIGSLLLFREMLRERM